MQAWIIWHETDDALCAQACMIDRECGCPCIIIHEHASVSRVDREGHADVDDLAQD